MDGFRHRARLRACWYALGTRDCARTRTIPRRSDEGRARIARRKGGVARHAPDICPETSPEIRSRIVFMQYDSAPPAYKPSESEIAAREAYLDILLQSRGKQNWCQLYLTEMDEANLEMQLRVEH